MTSDESERSAKAFNKSMTTKTMTTEEIHNFDTDDKGIEIFKDFAYLGSVINSNRDCSQEIKRRGSKGRIRKAHQEERCVIRDQG